MMLTTSVHPEYRSKTSHLREERVKELIGTLTVMPTAVNVPVRLMQLYQSPKSPGIDAFADVLIADAALSAKVLELANSAWFSRTKTVTRLSDALRMIGLSNLIPLLFGLSLAGIFNKTNLPTEQRAALWHSSLLKAVIAREWMKWRGDRDQAEEAFLCGALQDIALPLMFAADRAAAMELAGIVDLDEPHRASREIALYGADHANFGQAICTKLGLPELYIRATATHHKPDGPDLPQGFEKMKCALRLAAAVPHGTCKLDDHAIKRVTMSLLKAAEGATAAQLNTFTDHVTKSARQMLSLLAPAGINGNNMKTYLQDVSDQIARTMLAAIGNSNRTIEQLQEAQTELESRVRELDAQVIQSEYDPLTNVLARRGFFDRAQKMLALARKLQMGCAIGFVDINDFKSVNDAHGHHIGDQALVALAGKLRAMIRERGMIGRCGGDEFAFAMVVPTDSGLAAVESELRDTVSHFEIPGEGKAIKLSCSTGVVWLGVPDESQQIEDALKQADQQMYRTKRNSRAA
jgi:diguanylate cyclase (GGDEF)-like protein